MKSLLLQALREEVQASQGSGNPAKEIVNDALARVADRFEQLLEERQKRRVEFAEQRAQDERDLLNETYGAGGQG